MRIFLSHASEDRNTAEQIHLILLNAGHRVSFDRAGIQGGDDFHTWIQKHIKECELLIFLISPDSVARSSYALTELKFAQRKWPNPRGHLLPVIVRQTSPESIPGYLKHVSILEPEGNTAAEVCEELVDWKKRHRRSDKRRFLVMIFSSALLLGLIIAILIWRHSRTPAENAVNNPGPSAIPTANGVGPSSTPILAPSPLTPNNIGRPQTQTPNQAIANANRNQNAAAELTPVTFSRTSRVWDGDRPIQGAKISVVGEPEQGVVESDSNGLFTLTITHKQLNDTITVQVECDGFVTWRRDHLKLGEALPPVYLERKK